MRRFVLVLLSLFIGVLLSLSLVLEAQSDYLVAGTYNQNAPGITYAGTWTTVDFGTATSGNAVLTSTSQNYLRFPCVCDSFDVLYGRCTDCGVMEIYVDGYYVAGVNTLGGSDNSYGHSLSVSGLDATYKVITIKRGALNPVPPYGQFLVIDGFVINNSASAPPTSEPLLEVEVTLEVVFPEQTPEPVPWRDEYEIYDTEGNSRDVAFEYKLTAGEVIVGILLFGILFMMIVQFILASWKKQ